MAIAFASTASIAVPGSSPIIFSTTSCVCRKAFRSGPSNNFWPKAGIWQVRENPCSALFEWFREQPDFEDAGPQFARDKQPFAIRIVRDSVEHGARFEAIDRTQQALEINPANHFAGLRRDSRNPIRLPHVGENLSFDELQFVQLIDGSVPIADFETPLLRKRACVQHANFGGSVAHEELVSCALAVRGKAPPFAGIGKAAQQTEVAQVVDKSDLRLPGELHNFVLEESDALAKELRRQINPLKNCSGLQTDLAQR